MSVQLYLLLLQSHLKSVLQALIAHRTSWRLRYGYFQHSFGGGLTGHVLPPASSAAEPERPLPPPGVGQGEVTGSEVAMKVAQSAPIQQMEPLNLFHLRDALKVRKILKHLFTRALLSPAVAPLSVNTEVREIMPCS